MLASRPGLLVVLGLLLLATSVGAQTFTPLVSFSVHDEPRDGLGDLFNAFTGLLREQSTREDRALQEFDLTTIAGSTIASATLSGTISVNNAYDVGLRSFDFLLYAGNGVADLSDFEIAATLVGSGSYQPPAQSSFNYSLNATAALQTVLNTGAFFVGLKVDCTTDPNFPSILSATSSQLVVQVATATAAAVVVGSGCGGGGPALPLLQGSPPVLGQVFSLALTGAAPMSGGILVASPGSPTPTPLGSGCSIYVDPFGFEEIGPLSTDPSGDWGLAVGIPNVPALSGVVLTLQAAVLPSAGPLGLDLSNGLLLTFGN